VQDSCLPGCQAPGRRLPQLTRGSTACQAPLQHFNQLVAFGVLKHVGWIVVVRALPDTPACDKEKTTGSGVATEVVHQPGRDHLCIAENGSQLDVALALWH